MHPFAVETLSTVIRQQGGMDIEDPSVIDRQGLRPELFHIAGQTDDLHIMRLKRIADRRIESERVGVSTTTQMARRDVGTAGTLQSPSCGVVADDDAWLGVELTGGAGIENCL